MPFARLQALPTNAKPITSWPNIDEAFTDVARQLRRTIEEVQQQFLDTYASTFPVMNLPYERNLLFTGRETLLRHLYHALHTNTTTALTQAITGLGGIGKTQTAVEYAYRHQKDYDFIFWVKSDTLESLSSDFLTIASLLNLPHGQEQDQNRLIEDMKWWFLAHEHWLLIFDNADDLALVKEFLPGGGKGHTLLTTREQVTGRMAQRLNVEVMDEEEGALLLLQRAKLLPFGEPLAAASPQDKDTAQEISRLLGGLPLALDQVGAYIEETNCGLKGFVQVYHERQADLLKRRGKYDTDHLDVATTFSLAFEKVKQKSAIAADVLHLCAFLDPDAIPEELFMQGSTHLGSLLQALQDNPFLWNDTLSVLLNYSLVRRNPNQTLTIHRLVQSVIQQGMNKTAQKRWAERAVHLVSIAFPEVEHSTWQQCQYYLPQAQACMVLTDQFLLAFPEAAELFLQAGRYLRATAQYAQALPFLQRALAIREQTAVEHPETATATTLDDLGWLYREIGQYEKAEPLYQRALAIYEKMLGEHPHTATTLDNLASLYQDMGQYEKAEPLFLRDLAISEKMLGEHPDTAATLNNLASLYQHMGQYEKAEPLFQRALLIKEKRDDL